MGIFKNAILVTLNNGSTIRFTSLLKRTKAYHIILEMMSNYEEILDVQMKSEKSRNSDILRYTEQITNASDYFDNSDETCTDYDFDLAKDLNFNFDAISRQNEDRLMEVEDEFIPENLNSFKLVSEEWFDCVNLFTFFNKIYGEYRNEDGKSFIHILCENFENYNIDEIPHCSDISDIEFYDPSSKEQRIDEIESQFYELRTSIFEIEYTHTLHEFMAPPFCNVREVYTAYFVSPTKIYILK